MQRIKNHFALKVKTVQVTFIDRLEQQSHKENEIYE